MSQDLSVCASTITLLILNTDPYANDLTLESIPYYLALFSFTHFGHITKCFIGAFS